MGKMRANTLSEIRSELAHGEGTSLVTNLNLLADYLIAVNDVMTKFIDGEAGVTAAHATLSHLPAWSEFTRGMRNRAESLEAGQSLLQTHRVCKACRKKKTAKQFEATKHP